MSTTPTPTPNPTKVALQTWRRTLTPSLLEELPDPPPAVIGSETEDGSPKVEGLKVEGQAEPETKPKVAETETPKVEPTPPEVKTPEPKVEEKPVEKPAEKPAKPKKVAEPGEEEIEKPAKPEVAKTWAEWLGFEPGEEEREHLEALAWAEKRDAKLKGSVEREVARLKKVREFALKWEIENPGAEFDPDTAELTDGTKYRGVLKANPPAVDAGTQRRLEREFLKEQVKAEARDDVDGRMREMEMRQRAIELKPVITERVGRIEGELIAQITIDEDPEVDAELKKIATSKGMAALAEEMPDAGEMVRAYADRTKAMVEELLAVRNGGKTFDPRGNATHKILGEFVDDVANHFRAHGGDLRVVNGKSFVTPAQYQQLKPAAREKYWTFSDEDMVATLVNHNGQALKQTLQNQQAAAKKSAEARAKLKPKPAAKPPTGNETKPAPAPVTTPPPSPKLTPSPGGGPAGGPSATPKRSRMQEMLTPSV